MTVHYFADPPGPAPTTSQVAIAGPDGARATALLAAAKAHGTATLAALTERAVRRLLAGHNLTAVSKAPVLFDSNELRRLANTLSQTIATADLLGRSRVHGWAQVAARKAGLHPADGTHQFVDVSAFTRPPDDSDPFHSFDDTPVPHALPPDLAVSYFRRLVPTLGIDPQRYGPLLDRHAFTLAVATDQVLLDKVKQAIAAQLEGANGESGGGGNAAVDVQRVLDDAGVSVRNPSYADMVTRTNVLDAYNQGAMAELQTPLMQDQFPVWRYDGIRDGREGDDHRPHFDRYYPVGAAFGEVRGPRVFNCRCGFTPIHHTEWADLQGKGARVESRW